MKNFKRIVALAAAVTACFSASIGAYPAKPVSALTIIASITEASVRKDTIAIGETVPIELKWSTGREQEVIYASSDESVAVVDTNGVITGVGEGKATISITTSSYGMNDKETTIDIIVSPDVVPSVIYNTSELTLGQKLNAGDMLHYDSKNTGMVANVVNSKGSYDMAHLIEGDYLLPFNAEIVGIDGLIIYIAPELDNVTYLDARTLKAGDVVNTDTHLLCYDYTANGRVLPVFLPEYYEKYIGQGEIRVKSIDHESKKITLEAVPIETTGFTYEIKDGSIVFDSDSSNSMMSFIISSNLDYDMTVGNTHDGSTFTPKENGRYVLTVNEFTEEIIDVEDSHFHYFYPVLTNFTVDVSDDDITVEKKGSYSYYSEEQIKSEQEKAVGKEVLACYDVMAEGSDELLDGTYFSFVNGCMTPYNGESYLKSYITTQYDEYSTSSYFCTNLSYADIPQIDVVLPPRVIVSDDSLAQVQQETYTSSCVDGNFEIGTADIMSFCSVKALKDGKVTVYAEEQAHKLVIENGVFKRDNSSDNYVKGDANGDGEFGIADAVTVQNWLLGKGDSVNMQNVDLCNDGKIDVYDFCLLRKELTSVKTESIEAIMSVDLIGYSDELLKLAKSDAPSAVITSCEELEAYLAPITGAETVQFYLTELYNESFFENNVLLSNAIYQSCGEGVMYRIDSVYYEGDTLKVEYSDLYELRAYPDIVNGLFAQAVISKDDYHADNVIWEYTAE